MENTEINQVDSWLFHILTTETIRNSLIRHHLKIKSVNSYNLSFKNDKLVSNNCDPFIVLSLAEEAQYIKFIFSGISANKSNRIKLYYANDYAFCEENTIDLGGFDTGRIISYVNIGKKVNTLRIDLGDYDASYNIDQMEIMSITPFEYGYFRMSEIWDKIKKVCSIGITNKEIRKKTFKELKTHGFKKTYEKIRGKIESLRNDNGLSLPDIVSEQEKIIVCIHDLEQAGAQTLTLRIIRQLNEEMKFNVVVIALKGGKLEGQFKQYANLLILNQVSVVGIDNVKKLNKNIAELKDAGYNKAICNTTVTGTLAKYLAEQGIECISLVHELPTTIRYYNLMEAGRDLSANAKKIIFASNFVKDEFVNLFHPEMDKLSICPQSINKPNRLAKKAGREILKEKYQICPDRKIVMGCGFGDIRKGVDIFMQIAIRYLKQSSERPQFVWLGGLDDQLKNWYFHDIEIAELQDDILFFNFVDDPWAFFSAADVFLLTSREDPFPSVVLEAMYVGTPAIAFAKSGGIQDLLSDGKGILVDYLDSEKMTNALRELLSDEERYFKLSTLGREYVEKNFNTDEYVNRLVQELGFRMVNKRQVEKAYQASIRLPLESNRNRMLHFIDNFSTGGSSKLVVDIMEWLGHKYDQVIVANNVPDKLEYEGIRIEKFSLDANDEDILKFIRTFNPDIIHVHYWGSKWYDKIMKLLENVDDCIIIENVNIPIKPYTVEYVNKYIYVSKYTMQEFGEDIDKSRYIYPGSDFELFTRELNENYLPKDTIGMVYRLDIDKLTDYSIDVFIRVVQKRSQTKAIIVGGGPRYDQYYRKVEKAGCLDNFTFTGFVPYDNLIDYYRQLSIFVAPVWRESFGQVSPFAMSMGIPVVGYNIGALPEITDNEELLAEFENVEQLSDIIVCLLNDPKKCEKIGRFNQERSNRMFSLQTMIKEYEVVYDGFLENHVKNSKGRSIDE